MITFNPKFVKIFDSVNEKFKANMKKKSDENPEVYDPSFPYIGMGNPNADILLVGKEKALSNDPIYDQIIKHELNLNFFHWFDLHCNNKLYITPLDPSILTRTGILNGFNPFNPLLFTPTKTIVGKKHGHTYYGIQRFINAHESKHKLKTTSLFESLAYSDCTFSKVFLTELNTKTALTSSHSNFNLSTFLNEKNGRYDFIKNCEFFQNFKIVIIYAGKDAKYVGKENSKEREALIQIFNPLLRNSDCKTVLNFQIYTTTSGSTVVLCRHFAAGFSKDIANELVNLI